MRVLGLLVALLLATTAPPLKADYPDAGKRADAQSPTRLVGRDLSVESALGATLEKADGAGLHGDRFRVPVSPSYPAVVVCESGSGLLSGEALGRFASDHRVVRRSVQLENVRLVAGVLELRFGVRGQVAGRPVVVGLTVRVEPEHWIACMTDLDPRFVQAFQTAEARFFASMTWNQPSVAASTSSLRVARRADVGINSPAPRAWLGFELRREVPGAEAGSRRLQFLRALPAPGSDLDAWSPVLREEMVDRTGQLLEVRERRGRERPAELIWGRPSKHGGCTAITDGLETVRPCQPGHAVATTLGTEARLKRSLASGGRFRFEQPEYHPDVDPAAVVAVKYARNVAAGPGVVTIRVANEPETAVALNSDGQLLRQFLAANVEVEWVSGH